MGAGSHSKAPRAERLLAQLQACSPCCLGWSPRSGRRRAVGHQALAGVGGAGTRPSLLPGGLPGAGKVWLTGSPRARGGITSSR